VSSSAALSMQELATKGWTLLAGSVSSRFGEYLASYANWPARQLKLTRQLFDGLPMRISQGVIGESIVSAFGSSVRGGWHRGRTDTLESGAPPSFLPGFDFFTSTAVEPVRVSVINGGGRLARHDAPPIAAGQTVELGRGDLLIADCRTPRCWSEPLPRSLFWFSTVRPWMTQEMDILSLVEHDTPPRALAFFGAAQRPPGDVLEWLTASHRKREAPA